MAPPAMDANVPPKDIAPLVPGGTRLNVVTSRGGESERIPSSDPRVSPKQQAKCLRLGHFLLTTILSFTHPSAARTNALLHPFEMLASRGHQAPS